MPSKSKAKGNSWERDVCEHLTSIYNINFQRCPNSGAYLGQSNFNRSKQLTPEQLLLASGDIILPAFLNHISLECKFYKDFQFELLLTNNKQLNGWIEQASVGKKIPFVIFKINRRGGFVVYPSSCCLQIPGNVLLYKHNNIEYNIVKMDGWFETNKEALVALSPENHTIWTNALSQNNSQPLSG